MQTTLKYLTQEDMRVLMERGERLRYKRDEVILAEGSRLFAIGFIRKGGVRVERHYADGVEVLDNLEPGDIFGEMSFLEGTGTSASLVAGEQTEVDMIDGTWVSALLQSVPGLSTRFYHSLAILLSQRLWSAHAR